MQAVWLQNFSFKHDILHLSMLGMIYSRRRRTSSRQGNQEETQVATLVLKGREGNIQWVFTLCASITFTISCGLWYYFSSYKWTVWGLSNISILTELINNEAETQSPSLTPYSFCYRVTLPANDANGDCENELFNLSIHICIHFICSFIHQTFVKHLYVPRTNPFFWDAQSNMGLQKDGACMGEGLMR